MDGVASSRTKLAERVPRHDLPDTAVGFDDESAVIKPDMVGGTQTQHISRHIRAVVWHAEWPDVRPLRIAPSREVDRVSAHLRPERGAEVAPGRAEVLTATPELEHVQTLLIERYKLSYRIVMLIYRVGRRLRGQRSIADGAALAITVE